MKFIFRPLDSQAVQLRGEARRLAQSLPNSKGVSHRVRGNYLLRAVGDGNTVVVTAVPMPASVGAAPAALEWTGGYYGNGAKEYKHVVFRKLTHGKLQSAVFSGKDEALAVRADYERYVASGRKTIGTVSQLWPLGFIGDDQKGWLLSEPEYTVQGQCRMGRYGRNDSLPLAIHAVPCRTALLTLHTPFYRTAWYQGTNPRPSQAEHAIQLFRLNAKTAMRRWDDLDDGMPAAIKTDIQADYRPREGGNEACGLIEFSTELLGIDGTISPTDGTEGNARPAGCFEWSPKEGVIAVSVRDRAYRNRLIVARYNVDNPQELVWRIDIEAPYQPPHGDWVALYGIEEVNGRYGVWATRAGRGLSNGEPDQPDEILLIASHYGVPGFVTDPSYNDPAYIWPTGYTATRLYKINPATGDSQFIELYHFVTDRFYNENGALTEYELSHALGITIGEGSSAEPALICSRRTVRWTNVLVTLEGIPPFWEHIPVNKNSTGVDEIELVTVRSSGAVQVLDLGSNYPAYYMTGITRPEGRVGLFCCFRDPLMQSVNAYDPPLCEFAPGYVAVLVAPKSMFGTFVQQLRLVVCDVATGALVYESAALPLPAIEAYEIAAISCAEHGKVIEGIATGGVLLVTIYKKPSATTANPANGCFATTDLGLTFNQVLGRDSPHAAVHYLGSTLSPNPIGGGW